MTAYISVVGKELLRKRIFMVSLAITIIYLGLFGYGAERSFYWMKVEASSIAEQYMISVVLLFTGLFFGQFVIAFFVFFSTMGTISGEQESGLLLAVLSRPMARWKLYMAKWIGHGVWITVYSAFLFWSIVAIVHVFGHYPLEAGILLRSFLLFEWFPLLLMSISMLGSVYLPTLGNGIASALLFAFSWFSGILEGVTRNGNAQASFEKFNLLVSLLVPSDSIFRRVTYELIDGSHLPFLSTASLNMGPLSGSNIPSVGFLVYTVFYLVVLLVWGCRAFSRKDV